ncbi:prolyl-tRNA synthetase associated domain-containing protein [Candidatus Pacearchaeota archaeon]|nr:prolyl-tRNA synthetase associated domain-containing protein [Candidatus Pacearchaeota archaeon]
MDQNLKSYLDEQGIKYETYEHPAVFTVSESDKVTKHIPGNRSKNLFLKDEKGRFYLVSLPGEKRLDMKYLKRRLGVKELYFGSSEDLKRELNLTPGSVSIFGMIYARNTSLLIDREIWEAEFSGFHPNINTSTLVISRESLRKFCMSLSSKWEVVDLA